MVVLLYTVMVLTRYIWELTCKVGFLLFRKFRNYLPASLQKSWRWGEHTHTHGRWAIITGASSPIAMKFCAHVATKYKYNLLLIGKNAEKLKRLAKAMEATHNIKTKVLVHDFGGENDGKGSSTVNSTIFRHKLETMLEKLVSQYKATGNGGIGLLINCANARNEIPTLLHEIDQDGAKRMMKTNIDGTVEIIETVLPFLLQQGKQYKSGIITVSSHSCYHPAPMMALYSATNAFRSDFCKSLYDNCKTEGIDVLLVTPELMSSNLPRKKNNAHFTKSPSADRIVATAFRTLGHQKEAFPLLGHAQSTFFPQLFWVDPWHRFKHKMMEARAEILRTTYHEAGG